MTFLQCVLTVIVPLCLLSCSTPAPQLSLWGKVADLTPRCSHWKLKPHVFVPALREFTVCFSLKFEQLRESPWTAFMYRHPDAQYVELGLGGKSGNLVVWLFGTEWTTSKVQLQPSKWHSVCLCWSPAKERPALYVDGNPMNLMTAHPEEACPTSPSFPCNNLAPNGTLTLGASHLLNAGNVHIITVSCLLGKVALFRLWDTERSMEEVRSLYCIEGDVLKWEGDNWDTANGAELPDSSLTCEWSYYEVKVFVLIMRFNGNNTDIDEARNIVLNWLRERLPSGFSIQTLSLSPITGSRTQDGFTGEGTRGETLVRWIPPNANSYDCLLRLKVSPPLDVADVQNKIVMELSIPYDDPGSQWQLQTDEDSIHTTSVERFGSVVPSSPPTTTKPTTSSSTAPSTSTPKTTSTSTKTSSAGVSELYFEVRLNVSLTGDHNPEYILGTWLSVCLPDEMTVLDLQLLPSPQRYLPILQSKLRYSDEVFRVGNYRGGCVFQVRIMSPSDSQEMEELMRSLLLLPYNNGSISVETLDVLITRILIVSCNAESHHTRKGLFLWPATSGGQKASQRCPKNPLHNGTRHCKLSLSTHWMDPDLDECTLVVETIPDLEHIEVIPDNALDVVEMITDLLRNLSAIDYDDLFTVLNKLKDVVNIGVITPSLGQAIIHIISVLLETQSNLLPFTNKILNITETIGDKLVGYNGSSTLVAPGIAIAVLDVVPPLFSTLTFGVSSDLTGLRPEIFINVFPTSDTVAFISLPSVLQQRFPTNSVDQSSPRVQFQFYGIPMLFKSSHRSQILNTFVVSASVTNASSPIKDLDEDVEIRLHHLTPHTLHKDVQCVYWNFNKNDGQGGWDNHGCRTHKSSSSYTTCLCDHLTHFGVLLDVSRTQLDPVHEQILTIITYAGCGVSSLFLGVTVLTYTVFDKLRRDYPSQILINLCLALLGLNLLFLVNSWLSSWGLHALCVAAAFALHYFLLASFTWMGLEAVNMYFALVKVFNVYVPSYILKFCALGWGLPLMICILVLCVNTDAYGGNLYTGAKAWSNILDNSVDFCWIQDDVAFYVSVVSYAVLIFLFNIVVFVVVLIQIRHMRANSPAGTRSGLIQDLKGVASLTLLLGLTWTVGFFTWGPARVVLLYGFAALNTLQGLFIFLFHCLMKENVRKQWRIHLCLGRFRLDEYTEWSNSASAGAAAKPKLNPPGKSLPSVHSVKSNSTESTSASSDSSQRGTSCKRPNLGLLVNSLVLPRAQRNPTDTGGPPSHRDMYPTSGWSRHLLDQ